MTETAAEFFETWSLYDQLLDHNYMYHDELFAGVHSILAGRFGDRPIAVLDLGCGSARHVATALAGLRVARYVGYDLSMPALDHARKNLAPLNCPVELIVGDIRDGLEQDRGTYDVVLSSFAIHHLSADEKAIFFPRAADRLAAGGMLLLVDAMREEGEDRAAYLEGYCGWIRSTWVALPVAAVDAIIEHVRAHDFPETPSTLAAMARDAGLGTCRPGPRFGWHRTLGFER